ncbi:hypothetical protein BJX96DRAFT_174567 [Aspergillus floccosus]
MGHTLPAASMMLFNDNASFLAGCDDLSLDFTSARPDPFSQNHDFGAPDGLSSDLRFGYSNTSSDSSLSQQGSCNSLVGMDTGQGNHGVPAWHKMGSMTNVPLLAETSKEGDCLCSPACTSTIPWVSTWCRRKLDKTGLEKITEADVFAIPSPETIDCLFQYFFQFKHHRLPVLNEWHIYCLINNRPVVNDEMPSPISLALLYAVLFSACSMISNDELGHAGLSSFRAMGRAFYKRAKVLYDLGCEQSPMQKVQICLLMSTTTSPILENGMMPRENWILEAQKILKDANIPLLLSQNSQPPHQMARWRVLYSCCILRVIAFLLGSQRAIVASGLPFEIPSVTLSDMDDEIRAPWHLELDVKRKLADLFLAKLELFRHFSLICNVILHHTEVQESPTQGGHSRKPGRSIIGELEECEAAVSNWRAEYAHLLQDQQATSHPPTAEELPWLTHKAFLHLTYEFMVSTLHQIGITFGNPKATPWASKLREASHQAVWESASMTTHIIKQLIAWDALRYLPSAAVVCIFIPFTIHGILLKASTITYSPIVHGLFTCLQALESLSERYDDVDFFFKLHQAAVSLTHRLMFQQSYRMEHQNDLSNGVSLQPGRSADGDSEAVPPLARIDAYSQVLTLHNRILAEGSFDFV